MIAKIVSAIVLVFLGWWVLLDMTDRKWQKIMDDMLEERRKRLNKSEEE